MIIHRNGGAVWAIRQPDHGRQSAAIAAHLDPRWLGDPADRAHLLAAIAHHDDGWRRWEAAPAIAPDGLPLGFEHLPPADGEANWQRGVFGALDTLGPAAAAWIAQLGAGLAGLKDDSAGDYFRGLAAALALRAWPGRDPAAPGHPLHVGFATLAVADMISLLGFADWPGPHRLPLIAADGTTLELTLQTTAPGRVHVTPWPFLLPRLQSFPIPALRLTGHWQPRLLDPTPFEDRLLLEVEPG
jgi:hypothetical protein